jgi:two-component system chemotaxis response regulator CheY
LAKLELMLGSIGDCETAASGIQATERFVKAISDNQPYDLVTIDIELPDVPGLELLDRFCALEQKNGIPASKKIMITAHSKADYVLKARDKCDAFLVKPLRKKTLLAKLSELLPSESLQDQ